MQLYALEKNELTPASEAEKRKDYTCPECGSIVRLRKGNRRIAHFFHRNLSSCHQSQKGVIHLHLQYLIKNWLAAEGACIEHPFPKIQRIADVFCPKTKKVFEIQYSPMSLEEAMSRCEDYESLGVTLIWILHDDTFNQYRVGQTERYLRTKTCYYTNMDKQGKGEIYDQFELIKERRRIKRSFRKRVNLKLALPLPSTFPKPPHWLEKRLKTWSCYHKGDLIDLALQNKIPEGWRVKESRKLKNPLPILRNIYLAYLYKLLEI